MTMIIYSVPVSLYCAKLRILLRHKELAWQELAPPGGYGSDEYKQIVPSGNLPALVDGNLLLADSEAIAEYLNERYPSPPMLPESVEARAKVRERSRFHDTRLEPALRELFAHIKPSARNPQVVATQGAQLNARLTQLAAMIQSDRHADGDDLTLADCGYPITFAWLDALTNAMPLSIIWPDKLLVWRNSLEKQRAVVTELQTYKPLLTRYVGAQA